MGIGVEVLYIVIDLAKCAFLRFGFDNSRSLHLLVHRRLHKFGFLTKRLYNDQLVANDCNSVPNSFLSEGFVLQYGLRTIPHDDLH